MIRPPPPTPSSSHFKFWLHNNKNLRSVQFYGHDFGGTGVFYFFAFMHSFQKFVSDFDHFQTLL